MVSILSPSGPIRTGYLLVDPSNTDDETFAEACPMLDCTPAALSQSEHLMPRLIDVAALSLAQQDSLGETLLRELVGQRPPVVCAWLNCAKDAKALVRHITRFLVGPGMDGATVYWRYFDPRVFALVLRVFSINQMHTLLGPVTEWRFPWCQRWWSVSGTGQEVNPLLGIDPAWPTAQQWRSLKNSDLTARVLTQLSEAYAGAPPLTDAVCLRLLETIDASILDARRRLRLSDPDELFEFASLCARYGERFQLHPKLSAGWGELAHGQIGWSDFVAILDPSDYRLLDQYSQTQVC